MRCQRNKVCKKQPGNAPRLPEGTNLCPGCDANFHGDKSCDECDQEHKGKSAKGKGAKGKAAKAEATFDLVGMTEAQVQTVAEALEFFSRVGCGQFDFIESQMRFFDLIEHHDGREVDWDTMRCLCNEMKRCVGLVPNSHYGIHHQKVHEAFKSSYDIYKIILHYLVNRRDPEGKQYNVHSFPPLFSSKDKRRPELKCSQKAE